MKRPRSLRSVPAVVLLAMLLLLLSACQPPPPTFDFSGTSTVDGVDYVLELTVTKYDHRLRGHYLFDAVRGAFDGSANGQALVAQLSPSPTCAYSFTGVLTETTLTGSFEPTDCPGGKPGAWDLALK